MHADESHPTKVSNVCENREGSYFGAKLETCTAFPGGQASLNQVWTSSGDHKGGMLEYNHKFTMIALTRDRDGESVVMCLRRPHLLIPFCHPQAARSSLTRRVNHASTTTFRHSTLRPA
jgi:hypothetical protein